MQPLSSCGGLLEKIVAQGRGVMLEGRYWGIYTGVLLIESDGFDFELGSCLW